MDPSPTASQVASVLQQAANYRSDVRKAVIKVAPDDESLLTVDAYYYTSGRRYQIETKYVKCLDGRTCGQVLNDWLGPAPASTPGEMNRYQKLIETRKRYMDNTPAVMLELLKEHKKNPPKPPKRSKFDWDAPRPTAENPTGQLRTNIQDPDSD